MPISNKCAHCGATRGAWEFDRDGVPHRVKLVSVRVAISAESNRATDPNSPVQDRGQTLTLCEACNRAWEYEKRDGEAIQLKLF